MQGDRISRQLLITGGSGYLGRWVIRLACESWEVTATYLTDASHSRGVDWRRLDVRDQSSVEALIAGDDAAVVAMIEACRRGPPAARVEAVNVEPADGAAVTDGFTQRPTV